MADIVIRIAASSGDGVESSGSLLSKIAARSGLNAYYSRGYQSVIRGGHVWSQVRISDAQIYSQGDGIDILVALNQDAIDNQSGQLNSGAFVIYDTSKANADVLKGKGYKLVGMPLIELAVENAGDPIARNVVSIGALLKILGLDIKVFEKILSEMFLRKGQAVVDNNVKAANAGYNFAGIEKAYELKGDGKARYIINGNTALAIGAYASGCKFYAAYPMTPASTIMNWFAANENRGVVFKQTEDEIAAINMTIGAATAGVRAMCGTSGGGFSLMVEGLGLAGMTETPIVVVESQRTGPSTGLPTKTEQGDMLFVMHASQGEFPRIVVAPRSVDEAFYVAADAFNLAERYQCPVIILMDLFLSESSRTVDSFDFSKVKVDRGKIATAAGSERFKRYEITPDGVSPRSIPGTQGLEFIAASDEHDEYGDLVSDVLAGLEISVETRRKMHEKRMRKIDTMLKNENVFVPHVDTEGADYYLVCFGSTTGAALEAAERLRAAGKKVGVISFNYLMPMDKEKTKMLLAGKKLIDVECNYTGQLAYLLAANAGIDIEHKILRYDGEPITAAYITEKANEIMLKW